MPSRKYRSKRVSRKSGNRVSKRNARKLSRKLSRKVRKTLRKVSKKVRKTLKKVSRKLSRTSSRRSSRRGSRKSLRRSLRRSSRRNTRRSLRGGATPNEDFKYYVVNEVTKKHSANHNSGQPVPPFTPVDGGLTKGNIIIGKETNLSKWIQISKGDGIKQGTNIDLYVSANKLQEVYKFKTKENNIKFTNNSNVDTILFKGTDVFINKDPDNEDNYKIVSSGDSSNATLKIHKDNVSEEEKPSGYSDEVIEYDFPPEYKEEYYIVNSTSLIVKGKTGTEPNIVMINDKIYNNGTNEGNVTGPIRGIKFVESPNTTLKVDQLYLTKSYEDVLKSQGGELLKTFMPFEPFKISNSLNIKEVSLDDFVDKKYVFNNTSIDPSATAPATAAAVTTASGTTTTASTATTVSAPSSSASASATNETEYIIVKYEDEENFCNLCKNKTVSEEEDLKKYKLTEKFYFIKGGEIIEVSEIKELVTDESEGKSITKKQLQEYDGYDKIKGIDPNTLGLIKITSYK